MTTEQPMSDWYALQLALSLIDVELWYEPDSRHMPEKAADFEKARAVLEAMAGKLAAPEAQVVDLECTAETRRAHWRLWDLIR